MQRIEKVIGGGSPNATIQKKNGTSPTLFGLSKSNRNTLGKKFEKDVPTTEKGN